MLYTPQSINTTSNIMQYANEKRVLDIDNYCGVMVKACEVSGSPILCFMNQFQLVTLYFRKSTTERAYVVPLKSVTSPFRGVVPDLRNVPIEYDVTKTAENLQRTYYSNAITLLLETYSVINSCKPHGSTKTMSLFENGDGTLPPLSFREYTNRILRYTFLSKEVFVAAVVILDRFLAACNGAVSFRDTSMHRLFLTSFVLASKLLEDDCYNMAFFAKLGGVSKAELWNLEECFLNVLNFSLSIDENTFAWYSSIVLHLSSWIVQGHCKIRTWNSFIAQLSIVAKASVITTATVATGTNSNRTVWLSEALPR